MAIPEVWTSRDYPVLEEVAARIDRGEHTVMAEDVAQALSLSLEEVQLAGQALERRGLVRVMGVMGFPVLRFTDISGEAYLITGLHPDGDDAVSQLVNALRRAADEVSDPEEKSRLRRLADGVGGVSRDVLSGVLTTVITAAGRGMLG